MATVLLLLTFIHLATASVVNVALGKPASVSISWEGYRATTAVDGNTDAGTYGANRIINTAENQTFAWWKVDLQREVQDATVRIYFRTDYAWRRNGVELYTSTSSFPDSNRTSQGQLCHTVTGDPSGSDIPDVYTVTCPGRWRYLLLYTDTDNDGHGPVLDFREVEVLICSDGTYGEDCTKTCSSRRNCVSMPKTCERDGRCPGGCQSGWVGVDCAQACEIGFYGPGCSLTCTDRKCGEPSTECDHVTGQCVNGCHPGFKGTDCTEICSDGTYGEDCSKICSSRNCVTMTTTCEGDGRCIDGCQSGWVGVDCTHACDIGFYGPGCSLTCTDRKCSEPSTECDQVTGQCENGCHPGFKGIDCTEKCVSGQYGVNCAQRCGQCNGTCDHVLGHCPDGCHQGFCGLRCDIILAEPFDVNIGSIVAGTFFGTLLGVIMLFLVILACLVRQGRLQWVKSPEDKKPVQVSNDINQMSNIAPQPASEHAQSSSHVLNSDYGVLDPELMPGNKYYDVIEHKEYTNT